MFPLNAVFNIEALIIAVISCEPSPTARSEKARLRNSFFTVAGIVEAFIQARITKRFSRVATTENTKFKTQKQGRKIFCAEQVEPRNQATECRTVQPWFNH